MSLDGLFGKPMERCARVDSRRVVSAKAANGEDGSISNVASGYAAGDVAGFRMMSLGESARSPGGLCRRIEPCRISD